MSVILKHNHVSPQAQRMTSGTMSGMTWNPMQGMPSPNLEKAEQYKEEELMDLQWKSHLTSKNEGSETHEPLASGVLCSN